MDYTKIYKSRRIWRELYPCQNQLYIQCSIKKISGLNILS